MTAYKANPSEQNLQILRAARSKVQQRASQCASDYWLQLCSQIQNAADTGNIKVMYDGIKQALGPTQKKTAPLKSATGEVIHDRDQQMERWVEHYTEVYARENVVTEDALNAIECLAELEELDREPTIDELSEVLDSLACGKAPGKDGIPAEVLKCCKETPITELHEILCLCWSEGEVPQYMKDANRRHTVQKQRRQRRLQYLSRHIPPQCRCESLCTRSTEEAPGTCRANLARVAVVALSAHTHTHGVLDERGGQRRHATNPQHSLNNNKFR